ncbi:MAG: hypothetical protein MHM6MM_004414 [Cercozoa sp. M6MM]
MPATSDETKRFLRLVKHNSYDEVSEMLRDSADPAALLKATNSRGQSAVHLSVVHDDGRILKMLLRHGADPRGSRSRRKRRVDSPLFVACAMRHALCAAMLASHPKMPLTFDGSVRRRRLSVASCDSEEQEEQLEEAPLCQLVSAQFSAAVRQYTSQLEEGVLRRLLLHTLPLHVAILSPECEIATVEACISACQRAHLPLSHLADNMGNTALHLAAQKGDLSVVRLLLENDPSLLHAKNTSNETALHLASDHLMSAPHLCMQLSTALTTTNAHNDTMHNICSFDSSIEEAKEPLEIEQQSRDEIDVERHEAELRQQLEILEKQRERERQERKRRERLQKLRKKLRYVRARFRDSRVAETLNDLACSLGSDEEMQLGVFEQFLSLRKCSFLELVKHVQEGHKAVPFLERLQPMLEHIDLPSEDENEEEEQQAHDPLDEGTALWLRANNLEHLSRIFSQRALCMRHLPHLTMSRIRNFFSDSQDREKVYEAVQRLRQETREMRREQHAAQRLEEVQEARPAAAAAVSQRRGFMCEWIALFVLFAAIAISYLEYRNGSRSSRSSSR